MHVHWYVDYVLSERKKKEGGEPTFESTCKGCDSSFMFWVDSPTDIRYGEIQTKGYYGLMLVRRPDEELYMVVEQQFYVRDGKIALDQEYWVTSGTCPTNWFKVLMVAEDGDTDPHGCFEWVRSITYQDIEAKFGYKRDFLRGEGDSPNDQEEAFTHIFPEIVTGCTIVEGDTQRVNVIQLAINKESSNGYSAAEKSD
jgi:hypothetical protein